MHNPLEFTQSVGMASVKLTRRQLADVLISVSIVVGDCGISSNYFRTLCEMPTDLVRPSV